jgi:hypothetical protein
MSLSNYPAGVTGNEAQISGPDEWDDNRIVAECGNYGIADACDFAGGDSVEGVASGDSCLATFFWVCPQCGADNEVEFEPAEDDRGE